MLSVLNHLFLAEIVWNYVHRMLKINPLPEHQRNVNALLGANISHASVVINAWKLAK